MFENTDSLAGVEDDGDITSSAYVVEGLIEVFPDTIGQYTGLTDKNGKEIYEDDIVKSRDFLYIIFWHKGSFLTGSLKTGMSFETLEDRIGYYGCQVIGNIHDNPELMKGNE